MNIPSDLLYTKDHEWVRVSGSTARMGITDYAQDALGDVVFVQIPEVGSTVGSSETFSEIESTKSVNDVYAPVAGKVSAVNQALMDSPDLLNSDPYGDGWICEIDFDGNTAGLMSADEYAAFTG